VSKGFFRLSSVALRVGVAAMAGLVATAAGRSWAQDIEVFGGGSVWVPSQDSVYDLLYTPSRVSGIDQLFEEPDPRSRARQSLTLDADRDVTVGFGLSVYPHGVWGIQVLVDYAEMTLGGENQPHQVHLTWTTADFPLPDPVERSVDFLIDWPDTEGALEEIALSINGAARAGAGRRVRGSVSGGLTYFRVQGTAQRLGAFGAWLGGHGVIFSELYEIAFVMDPASGFGGNAGGTLDVSLADHVAAFADLRIFLASDTETSVEFDEIVSANVVTVPLERLQTYLAPRPIEIDPGFTRLLAGVKWVW
jgi:hypothetical protein